MCNCIAENLLVARQAVTSCQKRSKNPSSASFPILNWVLRKSLPHRNEQVPVTIQADTDGLIEGYKTLFYL